jgi:hypothetical protein
MTYFSEKDRSLIESLRYDVTLEPSFDLIKSCLVWADERADGLTRDGYEKLCDLWIARSFLHRGMPFSSWKLAPEYFGALWQDAMKEVGAWPGFLRLQLSKRDRAYYERQLRKAAASKGNW